MDDNYRDILYTINKDGKRNIVYPKLVKGYFFYRRAVIAYFLVLFYLSLPWITIGGKQAVFLNIAKREFTFFGTTLFATDTIFLFLALLSLTISLFFFTALFGRVWCGWACPETVFLEFIFRPLEHWIEGGPVQRKRLAEAPWSKDKIIKKGKLHLIRACIAWVIASTALAYFIGREPLIKMMVQSPFDNIELFSLTIILMGLMAFQFGWFREQFCTIVCPYARFQSVLLDSNSLIVGYDAIRGEPRGKKKDKEAKNLGDCVDCGMCVKVCPTGIDIRNGLQLECVNCTQCIDACDSVMEKLGRPKGLIRYDSEASLLKGVKKVVSKRVFVYASILLTAFSLFLYLLLNRVQTDFQIVRGGRDVPFSVLKDERITNHLHAKLKNKSENTQTYIIGLNDKEIDLFTPVKEIVVNPKESKTVPIFINFYKNKLTDGKFKISIHLKVNNEIILTQDVTLLGPNE